MAEPGPFVFDSYRYDSSEPGLALRYRFADGPAFEERIVFEGAAPPPASGAAATVLDRLFRLVFLLAGVSYYKAFAPRALSCAAFAIDPATAAFVTRTYEQGLGEFAFRNRLTLHDRIAFAATPGRPEPPVPLDLPRRSCVPVGGGKDSIVTIECLKQAGEPLLLFSLGTATPIDRTIERSGLPFFRVRRRLDPLLLELNRKGALNGHVPITAILSTIALAGAVLYGYDTVAMSNEHSASIPNLEVAGVPVNHQYSKSLAFETDLAGHLAAHVSPGLAYFSLLRPLSELAIAGRFARLPQYFDVFRSCNTAFRQVETERGRHWCGDCPKCRFVFLALAPFLAKSRLVAIFDRDLLDDVAQTSGFAQLCGIEAFKPFECVGTVEESAAALAYLATQPEWCEDRVAMALAPRLPRDTPPLPGFLAARHPHRVPADFLAALDAGG
jgi:hypothetical protein